MIKSMLAATTLTLGLATVAYANLSMSNSAILSPRLESPVPSAASRIDAVRYAETKTSAPSTLSDADDRTGLKAAPRQIPLPGADAPSQGYGGAARMERPTAPAQIARETVSPVSAGSVRSSDEPGRTASAPPPRNREGDRPGYRKAKWSGGEGATWKTGRDAYGFSGKIGGCRIIGVAGPRGYTFDRSC